MKLAFSFTNGIDVRIYLGFIFFLTLFLCQYPVNSSENLAWFALPIVIWAYYIYHRRRYNVADRSVSSIEIAYYGIILLGITGSFIRNTDTVVNDYSLLFINLVFFISVVKESIKANKSLLYYILFLIALTNQVLLINLLTDYFLSRGNTAPVGLFMNSGVSAEVYTVTLPGTLYYLYKIKNTYLKFFLLTLLIGTLFVTQSRSSILAISFLVSLFFLQKRKIKIRLLVVPLLLIGAYFLSFHYKINSSLGRLLIWKITLLNSSNYFWTGVGLGNFSFYYPNWQSTYFESSLSQKSEELVADDVYFSYNEFLQLFAETGILGIICFLALIWFILSSKNTPGYQKEVTTFKSCFLIILLICLFSKPLHTTFLLVLFCLLGSIMASFTNSAKIYHSKPSLLSLLHGVHGLHVFFLASLYVIYRPGTNPIEKLISSPSVEQIIPLISTTDALYTEGVIRLNNNQPSESIYWLKQASRKINGYDTILALGISNHTARNYKAAEVFYKKAQYLVPNRFYPKYLLMKLYYETGKYDQCRLMATIIVQYPAKVASQEVDNIKRAASRLLQAIR